MKWPFRWNPFKDSSKDEYSSIVDDMVSKFCEYLDDYTFRTFTYNPEIVDTHAENSETPIEIRTNINEYLKTKYVMFTCNGDVKIYIHTDVREAKSKFEKNHVTISINEKDHFALNVYHLRKIAASVKNAGVKSKILAAKKAAEKI